MGSDVDPADLAWVEAATDSTVRTVAPLVGGLSSETHRLDLESGQAVVLRRIRNAEWLAREPDLLENEAVVLRLLACADLPAPRLVAVDSANARLAMSFLPGRMIVDADGLSDRLGPLCELAGRIAEVALPADHGLPVWRSWVPADVHPPEWGSRSLWAAAIEEVGGRPAPDDCAPVLLHRDLHPLNLLWEGEGVTGVVDWVNACVGHPHAELAHLRWNLSVLVDASAADALVSGHPSVPGASDPWWDLAGALSLLPGPIGRGGWHAAGRTDLTDARVIGATARFVRAALDRL